MSRPASRRVVALVLGLFLVTVASPVAAAGPSTTVDAAANGGTGTKSAVTAASVELNPWGCSTTTQNPHMSTHFPGTVAAVAIHQCTVYWETNYSIPTYPDYQTLDATLYYESCFLIFCGWNQVDHWSSGANYVATKLSRTLEANCNNSNSTRWRIYATGSSYGFSGSSMKLYTSAAETIATVGCGH